MDQASSSTAAQGKELAVYTGNQVSSPSASDNPSEPPTADAHSWQFSEQGAGGSSKKEGQTSTKIKISDINSARTVSNIFNNTLHKDNNFEGELTKVTTKGGVTNIGNGSPPQRSKKRTKKKRTSTSFRAARQEVERAEADHDQK